MLKYTTMPENKIRATMLCGADGCSNAIVNDYDDSLMLSQIAVLHIAYCAEHGWKINAAVPCKRRAVKRRDELQNPIQWHMVDGTMIDDCCPSCAAKLHKGRAA